MAHSWALSASGSLYVWGDNSKGQLGLPPELTEQGAGGSGSSSSCCEPLPRLLGCAGGSAASVARFQAAAEAAVCAAELQLQQPEQAAAASSSSSSSSALTAPLPLLLPPAPAGPSAVLGTYALELLAAMRTPAVSVSKTSS